MGILTTGKSLVSPTAKNRRYRLEERVGYGGVEKAQDFGERLFLKGEAHLGFSRARHLKWVPAKYKEGNRKEPSRKNQLHNKCVLKHTYYPFLRGDCGALLPEGAGMLRWPCVIIHVPIGSYVRLA